jgi:hypothetical protein
VPDSDRRERGRHTRQRGQRQRQHKCCQQQRSVFGRQHLPSTNRQQLITREGRGAVQPEQRLRIAGERQHNQYGYGKKCFLWKLPAGESADQNGRAQYKGAVKIQGGKQLP